MSRALEDTAVPGAIPAPPSRLIALVFPGDTNHHGTLFGGAGLALMDRIAFIAATRHGRVPFVTASVDRVDFQAPARVGELVELVARVTRVGRKSMTVEVEMVAEGLVSGERRLCTRGSFSMVAVPPPHAAPGWCLPPVAAVREEAGLGPCASDIVFADQANSFGRMFGGEALAAMTRAAFVAATRHGRRITVLAASERVDFRAPVAVGAIVDTVATVVRVGRTSMTVAVELWSEDLMSGARACTAKGRFVMVAVDGRDRPVPVRRDETVDKPS
ncbi:acyl-CoA thioesterase [Shinella sp. HZN7]|uniref:acyl-CoA thioesterase n=1 Tax=Shinella sp. (strain HZN7) TaxID=879274 RepID=UPI0007DA8752|nr:hotdog domain-containing protein [Shinella sp. HZN7]ANH04037.1 acyl-CoA thioesterase [Shinella sp. HZN7]